MIFATLTVSWNTDKFKHAFITYAYGQLKTSCHVLYFRNHRMSAFIQASNKMYFSQVLRCAYTELEYVNYIEWFRDWTHIHQLNQPLYLLDWVVRTLAFWYWKSGLNLTVCHLSRKWSLCDISFGRQSQHADKAMLESVWKTISNHIKYYEWNWVDEIVQKLLIIVLAWSQKVLWPRVGVY